MARAEDLIAAQEALDDLARGARQDVDLEGVAGDRRELDLYGHRRRPEADEIRLLLPVEPLLDRIREQPERLLGVEDARATASSGSSARSSARHRPHSRGSPSPGETGRAGESRRRA
ncbi:MAG: hypothetical protein R3F21_25020 [Myxococcota bacterium]